MDDQTPLKRLEAALSAYRKACQHNDWQDTSKHPILRATKSSLTEEALTFGAESRNWIGRGDFENLLKNTFGLHVESYLGAGTTIRFYPIKIDEQTDLEGSIKKIEEATKSQWKVNLQDKFDDVSATLEQAAAHLSPEELAVVAEASLNQAASDAERVYFGRIAEELKGRSIAGDKKKTAGDQ